MTYIVQRKTRFNVVAYDGLDPLTGRERRRWIPIGHDRAEAEAVVSRLDSRTHRRPGRHAPHTEQIPSRRSLIGFATAVTEAPSRF